MSLFSELKRRNVFRVAIAYLAAAWLLVEVLSALFDIFGSPDWLLKSIVALLAVGWPIALVFSWAYEITPEGLKKTEEIDQSQSITHATAKRLDEITIGLIVVALAVLLLDRFWLAPRLSQAPEIVAAPTAMEPSAAADEEPEPDAPPKSIAVLPFADMSPAGDQEYFADGISEELLNLLARVEGLKVAARTSAFKFKDADADIAEIARVLNVSTVLEGSIRKDGNQVRITAQLIDAHEGYHLWSDSFDRELSDIFRIQDEIAQSIVDALKVELLGTEGQTVRSQPADSLEVYDLYLAGRQHFHQRGESRTALPRAIELFEQATEMDPDYALAWSGLADSYGVASPTYGVSLDASIRAKRALEAAKRAIALAPDLAEANASMGLALADNGELQEAEDYLRKAIDLNPSYSMAHFWLGHHLAEYYDTRQREVLESFRTAAALDPLHPIIAARYGYHLSNMGEPAAGKAVMVKALRFNPDSQVLYQYLTWQAWGQGALDEAHHWAARALQADPASPAALSRRVRAEVLLGRSEAANYWLNQMHARGVDPKNIVEPEAYVLDAAGRHQRLVEYMEGWLDADWGPWMRNFVLLMHGRTKIRMGDIAGGQLQLEKIEKEFWPPGRRAVVDGHLAYANLQEGNLASARAIAQERLDLLEEQAEAGLDRASIPYRRALMLLILERPEEAFDALSLAFEKGWRRHHSAWSFAPLFEQLIGADPRYIAFKQKVLADVDRMREEVEATELAGAAVN